MGGDSSGDSDAQQVRSGAWAFPVLETFWVILMTSRGGVGWGLWSQRELGTDPGPACWSWVVGLPRQTGVRVNGLTHWKRPTQSRVHRPHSLAGGGGGAP